MIDSDTPHKTTEIPAPHFSEPPNILVVCAPYYTDIAALLLQGCSEMLAQVGAHYTQIDVPGALEIGPAIAMAHGGKARGGVPRFDGYVALGCVIRGETTHYETVCNDSARALTLLGLREIAIGNGILTVETYAQALTRADPKRQNKGRGAAAAALHLVALQQRLRDER